LIDLHCHALPGIDDGPATLEDSIALCRVAAADGTRTIVATPHLSWDYPDVDAGVIHAKVGAVNDALRSAAVDVIIAPGAEVALSRASEVSDAELGALRLAGGPYVLLEVPWNGRTAGVVAALRTFMARDFRIVLAHPERSPVLARNPALVRELVDVGALCCLSVRSLSETAGRDTRSAAWNLLEAGLAHVIASDAHDTSRNPPVLRSTLERVGLSAEQIAYFTDSAPEAIIHGTAVQTPPHVTVRNHRRWSLWRRAAR
jgi:protein-tyrosine phosphatase